MTSSSNVITEDGGRQNMYASEPRMQIDPEYTAFSKEAETDQRTLGNDWLLICCRGLFIHRANLTRCFLITVTIVQADYPS